MKTPPDCSSSVTFGGTHWKGRWLRCSVVALSLFLHQAGQAAEKEPATLPEALQEIQALKARLGQLENIVTKLAQTNQPAAPIQPRPPTAEVADNAPTDAGQKTIEQKLTRSGFIKWNELSIGKSKFKLYGFLRLDGIYDDSRPNNTQIPAFIRSEDPNAPAAIASSRNAEDFSIYPRLTRFGIDFDGPEVPLFGHPKTTGKLEIDFYNMPSSESRNAPRMRHAYLKLNWDEAFLLAGQTSDVISPIYPIVNPDFLMWGAGNLGDRRPQLRAEYAPKVGPGKFIFQGELGLTGANDAQDLDPATAGGFRDGETSGRPAIQGRVAYAMPLWAKQNLEFGIWGHKAWEKTDSPIGLSGQTAFESEVAGLDLTLPLYQDKLWLKGEIWTGKNLDDVRGGILQGINVTTGREVHAEGGWIELGARPLKWFSISAGYSTDNPRNSDLPTSGPTVGRTLNRIYYGAFRGFFDPIEIGFDYLNWTTDYAGGFGRGTDNRFQTFISYKF
jgi:hypothetical protein